MWYLNFDGACEPVNPGGTASWGFVLFNSDGDLVAQGAGVVGTGPGMTNNVAEWAAVEEGVRRFREMGLNGALAIRGDSQLVVKQLGGEWRCKKPHLEAARDRVLALLDGIAWAVEWVPREENQLADELSRAI